MELKQLWSQLGLQSPEKFWIVEVFIAVFLTLLASFLLSRLLARLASKLELTRNIWDDIVIEALRRPAIILVWTLGLS